MKTLQEIVNLIQKDKILNSNNNNDDWALGYFSGIIDAWIYLEQNQDLSYYPWNKIPWSDKRNHTLKGGK